MSQQKLTRAQKRALIKKLRPIDDLFMRCMFADNLPLVQFVLRILMKKENLIITEYQTQKDIVNLDGAHSAALDIMAKDALGQNYNLEVQCGYPNDIAKRALYYSGIMSRESLDAGEKYNERRNYYVLIIMEHDLFKERERIYYSRHVVGKKKKIVQDAEHIRYFNSEAQGNDNLGKLMHDFHCSKASEMLLEPMAKATRYYKETKEGRRKMERMLIEGTVEELFKEWSKESNEETRRKTTYKNKREFAEKLLREGSFQPEKSLL